MATVLDDAPAAAARTGVVFADLTAGVPARK
jgi:hypothetical protein